MNLIKPIALLALGGLLTAGCAQKDYATEAIGAPDPASATDTAPPPVDPAYSMPSSDEPAPASSDTLPTEPPPPNG